MTTTWIPRPALTQQEMVDLVLSVSAYIKPTTPCAKYNEVMNMKSKYQSSYGISQLTKDFKMVQERMKGRGGCK